jgi:hypothetical protein
VHALVALGRALHLAGKPDEAAATLRDALRLRPDDPTALAALNAAMKDKRYAEDGPPGPGKKIPRTGNVSATRD